MRGPILFPGPKALYQAIQTISPSTVAGAFSAPGIFPLEKYKVKSLENSTPEFLEALLEEEEHLDV